MDVRYTASAQEFFGVPGHNIRPEALKIAELSDNLGCGATLLALQAHVKLKPGEQKTLTLLMGYGDQRMIEELCAAGDAERRLEKVRQRWRELVGGIRVTTSAKSSICWSTAGQTYTARRWAAPATTSPAGRTASATAAGRAGVALTSPAWARAHILGAPPGSFRGRRAALGTSQPGVPYAHQRRQAVPAVHGLRVRTLTGDDGVR